MDNILKFFEEKKAEIKTYGDIVKKKEEELNRKKELLGNIENANLILQQVAKETQQLVVYNIKDIVQMVLDVCFPGKYKFKINFEMKRGKTEADMYLETQQGLKLDIINSNGGGVVDVVSFGLRVAVMTLSQVNNVMVFDEPFKFISSNLKPKMAELLKKMSSDLGLQIIMTTHEPIFAEIADKSFFVSQKDGVSKVREINV